MNKLDVTFIFWSKNSQLELLFIRELLIRKKRPRDTIWKRLKTRYLIALDVINIIVFHQKTNSSSTT